MPHNVRFLSLARLEVMEGRDWYERPSAGLGDAFIGEVDRLAERIAENPLQFPVLLADVRRARLSRFPYGLFCRLADEECFVLACFHASRDPKRWQERT